MTSPFENLNARAIRARRLRLLADIALGALFVVTATTTVIIGTDLLIAALAP
jgi:hypothetical protein